MAFGITDQGFLRPRLADIQAEINQSLISTFGAGIDLSAGSVFSTLSGIFSEREDLLWQAVEDVYNSQYPDTAFGASLDNVGAISGIPRLGELPSRALAVRLFGSAGTLVPAGTQVAVQDSPTSVFATDNDVTLIVGQDSIQTITFSAVPTSGQWKLSLNGNETPLFAFNALAAVIQAALSALPFGAGITVAGNYSIGFTITFAGAAGKQEQPTLQLASNTLVNGITPVTPSITLTQAGVNQGVVACTAIAAGPTIANAGTLTVIVTPVGGLTAVLNVTDAVVGRSLETDNEYRARRAQTLQIAGAGTVEAIRAQLLSLTGVTAVIVFENDTLITDPDGRPAKSFEAIVQGGEDQAIRDLLWQIKPAGILTDGSVVGTITDSQGQEHTIRFSRPTDLLIYVKLNLSINSTFPANGVAAVKQAIVDKGNSLGIGKEVVVIPYLISALATIPGIEDADLFVGLSPSPTLSDNIPVAANQIAVFDTSRVVVVTV